MVRCAVILLLYIFLCFYLTPERKNKSSTFSFPVKKMPWCPFAFSQFTLVPLKNAKIALMPFKTEGNFLVAL